MKVRVEFPCGGGVEGVGGCHWVLGFSCYEEAHMPACVAFCEMYPDITKQGTGSRVAG